jgi:hypothetical protein
MVFHKRRRQPAQPETSARDEERTMFPKRRLPMTPIRPDHENIAAPGAFFLCPIGCLPPAPEACRLQQQALYEWAYQQAREVLKPSLLERDLLAVWN